MQSTIEKYDEGFDGNQILFLDGLIKNCQLERKQSYEMPEPAPILEVPVEPKDIPFVQRLPERRVFKENRNNDTFAIDEARRVIYVKRRVEDGGTEKTYYSKINAIMSKSGRDRTNGVWIDVYETGFDKIIYI
jgi:hypothetical protein